MFDPGVLVIVALAGGLGSAMRLILSFWRGRMPWGVLLANIIAGLIIGFMQVFTQWNIGNPVLGTVLLLGLCGGLSTFSAVAADTGDYWRDRAYTKAISNLAANLTLPVVALWLPVMFLIVLVN